MGVEIFLLDTGQKTCHIGAINSEPPLMPRPRNAHLRATWKLSLPAPTVARVDMRLEDPLTGKPKYGARGTLVNALLINWLSTLGDGEAVPIPSLEELRTDSDA